VLLKDKTGHSETGPRSRWTRFSEIGVSLLIVVMVAVAIVGSIPKSTIKTTAGQLTTPIALATGLDQGWGVFSPNPPRIITELEVHVIMGDGEDEVWRLNADRTLPEYRWRKLKEGVIKYKTLRPAFAKWVVREVSDDGDKPVRVLIVLQTETLPLPGQGEPKVTRKLLLDQKVVTAA
jgi:hypothetical protein